MRLLCSALHTVRVSIKLLSKSIAVSHSMQQISNPSALDVSAPVLA